MVHEEVGQQVGIISHPQQPSNLSNTVKNPVYWQVLEGTQFDVLCQTDSYYEFCIFVSPMGQRCEFEWRRKVLLSILRES